MRKILPTSVVFFALAVSGTYDASAEELNLTISKAPPLPAVPVVGVVSGELAALPGFRQVSRENRPARSSRVAPAPKVSRPSPPDTGPRRTRRF